MTGRSVKTLAGMGGWEEGLRIYSFPIWLWSVCDKPVC